MPKSTPNADFKLYISQAGLVSEVVATEETLPRAQKIAKKIAAKSGPAAEKVNRQCPIPIPNPNPIPIPIPILMPCQCKGECECVC